MIGQRLNETLRFWWQNITALLLVTLPFALLGETAQALLGPAIMAGEEGISVTQSSAVILLLLHPLTAGAVMAQLTAIQSGGARSLGDCLLFSLRAMPLLLLTYMLLGLSVYFGLLLFFFPGIWLYARLCQAPFIAVLENRTPLQSLQQSFLRSATDQWQILAAITLIFMLIVIIVLFAATLVTGLLGSNTLSSLILGGITGLVTCLLNILVFRYYGLLQPQAAD